MTATDALASNPSRLASTPTLLELGAEGLQPLQVAPVPDRVLTCDEEPDHTMTGARCLAIEFPAFNDGRGLSLGVLLRQRFGFKGELRAVGETHPELYHYLYRCGFDSVLQSTSYSLKEVRAAYQPHHAQYQASVRAPQPHYRR